MKLGFIGAGNMAGAILLGGAHGANVYDVNAETMRRNAARRRFPARTR